MNIVDSSAWLEYFASGPNASFFAILATARTYGATVWTQDSDFKGLPDVQYRKRRA